MDQTPAVLEAIVLATTLGLWLSTLQEWLFGKKLEGAKAFYLSVALSLVVGVIATARAGGFVVGRED